MNFQRIKLGKISVLGLVVFAFSWPPMFLFIANHDNPNATYWLLGAMVLVSVGTFVAGRFVFGHDFQDAGWRTGKLIHYILAFGLALLIWFVPTLIGIYFLHQPVPINFDLAEALKQFGWLFFITLIPAFGEEFGWRGYLLPRLAERYTPHKAVLMHSVIWWVWHLPFVLYLGWNDTTVSANSWISCAVVTAVSFIPAVLHGVIFAMFWLSSASLGVAVFYHAAFDEVRDGIEKSVGFNALVEPWQMVVISVVGMLLLWKGNWIGLKKFQLVSSMSEKSS